MFVDNKQIHLFCDVGKKKVILVDSHLNKIIFAKTNPKERIYGEYLALSFSLRYIKAVYQYRDILLITDAKSQSDVLNGNSSHNKKHLYKKYSDDLKSILDETRYTNIVNILWMPRRFNYAGIIMQRFSTERTTIFSKTNMELVDFDSLKPLNI